jgi:hypothetical protein
VVVDDIHRADDVVPMILARAGKDDQFSEQARVDRGERAEAQRPGVLLVAQPEQRNRARLQSILDNGSTLGIVGCPGR